uniref:Transposase n=1 Tax=uncultured Aminicenantes bacterium TaxID=174294 RepID=Q2YZZ2_9BACT|nr:Transposase [uncultured Aminicenantes bacterium]
MNTSPTVFSQIMDFLPIHEFRKCVRRYRGDYKIKSFSCYDQFLCLAFAQLTYRESLRDIESCLRAMKSRLYHMGFRGLVSRNTLAHANETRDWRIYADFARILIARARPLYANEDLGIDLDNTVYAFDSTTIDLCLSLFPWAVFRKNKGAVKVHTLLDLRGSIPSFIHITHGKIHDVNILDEIVFEPGSFYVLDRGYVDYNRLYNLHRSQAFFVIRAKSNMRFNRLLSSPIDPSSDIRSDQVITFTGIMTHDRYPERIRRIRFFDRENDRFFVFLTNNFSLPSTTIAQLYKLRWQIEIFFRWIKQNLRIKTFFGTSENAVKTQIWAAIAIYVLAAIVKKQLPLEIPLYNFLQILSVTVFEKTPLNQLFTDSDLHSDGFDLGNQLLLFNL